MKVPAPKNPGGLAAPEITRPPRPVRSPDKRRRARRRGLAGLYQNCQSALQSVRANKMRSLLTSLGIIIGVGAVVVLISISEASTASINSRLESLNPPEIMLRQGSV